MGEGEPMTFDAFFTAEQGQLVRFATVLSGSRPLAEEIVQEVFVRMYQRWDTLTDREGSLPAYARRAVTNEFLSWRRSWATRHIRVAPVEELDVRTVETPDDALGDRLWEALRSVTSRQRAAIVLRHYEGLSDAEIGRVLGCAQVTVRSLISRGLRTLQVRLGSAGGEGIAADG